MTEDEVALLLGAARAASPSNRVERFRDQIATHGDVAIAGLLELYRAEPELRFFAVTVLSVIGKQGSDEAWTALRSLAHDANDSALQRFIEQSLPRPSTDPSCLPSGQFEEPEEARAGRPAKKVTWLRAPDEQAWRSLPGPVNRINEARRRRGEPELDAAEFAHVVANLQRRELDPARRWNVCWVCRAVVDEASNPHCGECNWLVCWCGACREPKRPWPRPNGPIGPCRNEAYLFSQKLSYPDRDYLGHPILTTVAPADDASDLRVRLARHQVGSVYHWSPERSVGSILRHGILSRSELDRRGVRNWVPHGYGSADKEHTLAAYVGVAIRVKPVMMREWSATPVVLELDPEVLTGQGTLFVPGNSASSRFMAPELLALTGAASFDALFASSLALVDGQAEAWVKGRVPRVAISTLHVSSPDLANRLVALLRTEAGDPDAIPPVMVSPTMFA